MSEVENKLKPDWLKLLREALTEDKWDRDITSRICSDFFHSKDINPKKTYEFALSNRNPICFSGKAFLEEACRELRWDLLSVQEDGKYLENNSILLKARAPAFALLSAERTILNTLQHLCGITTEVAEICKVIDEAFQSWSPADQSFFKKPILFHTRKTLPNLRQPQIYACQVGGAQIHRLELQSRAMFKDNHKEILKEENLNYGDLIAWAKSNGHTSMIENAIFEADNFDEAKTYYKFGIRHILLDNFTSDEIRSAIKELKGANVEVSGGLTKKNIADFVIPGVERLSLGSITHSVIAADIGLDINRQI